MEDLAEASSTNAAQNFNEDYHDIPPILQNEPFKLDMGHGFTGMSNLNASNTDWF